MNIKNYDIVFYDQESYPNNVFFGFKFKNQGEFIFLEEHNYIEIFDAITEWLRKDNKLIFCGFNNSGYDKYGLNYCLLNYNKKTYLELSQTCHQITQDIIYNNYEDNDLRKKYHLSNITNQLDVQNFIAVGGSKSAKESGVIFHYNNLVENPVDFTKEELSEEDINQIKYYNETDINLVMLGFEKTKDKIELHLGIIEKHVEKSRDLL
jgi:hypothetical protein